MMVSAPDGPICWPFRVFPQPADPAFFTGISMARTDAIVLGAGIVGVSVALHLAKRGLAVALVDRSDPARPAALIRCWSTCRLSKNTS
jgi:NADPH-dependent 2,4-dienoyl-CoA reductase/sulfur reductase-like enzyme